MVSVVAEEPGITASLVVPAPLPVERLLFHPKVLATFGSTR
jgi:hypothetical protein